MVEVDFASLSSSAAYHLMTQMIIPRPIAWVLTRSPGGGLNLAPFSYFNAVCSEPPLVMISVGHRADGTLKDTAANLVRTRSCVIHVPRFDQRGVVQASAEEWPAGVSEVDKLALATVGIPGCDLPRLADAAVALVAELHDLHVVGAARQHVFYLELKRAVLAQDVIAPGSARTDTSRSAPRLDPSALDPLARLGASFYGRLADFVKA